MSKESLVWDFFERDEVTAGKNQCQLCDKPYSNGGGTSNLMDHLRRRHPAEYQEARTAHDNGQPRVTGMGAPEKKRLDRLLIKMMAKDYQPFSVVEDQGFLEMARGLNPRYKPPSRKHISQVLIPELYEEVKNKVSAAMAAATDIALTTDTWTSRANEAFIAVTAHFIGEDEKLDSACLDVSCLEEAHTAGNLRTEIKRVIDKFHTHDKIRVIVTDNGANIKAAVRDLGYTHLSCAAHTLNLAVEDAIGKTAGLADFFAICSVYTTYFHQSTKASENLRAKRLANGKTTWKLVRAVITRWNSRLKMMLRLLELRSELVVVLAETIGGPRSLEAEEWQLMEEMTKILAPVEEMTVALSAEKYTTASAIVPLAQGLLLELRKLRITILNSTAEEFILNLIESTNTRLSPYENHYFASAATFLDPRYKKEGFMVPSRADEAEKAVVTQVRSKIAAANVQQAETDESADDPEAEPRPPKQFRLLSFLNERRAENRRVATATSDALVLLRAYTTEPVMNEDIDPIRYWTSKKTALSQVALAHLCAPGTSVPSERVWSKAGQVITDRRASLSRGKAGMLIFLHGNTHRY